MSLRPCFSVWLAGQFLRRGQNGERQERIHVHKTAPFVVGQNEKAVIAAAAWIPKHRFVFVDICACRQEANHVATVLWQFHLAVHLNILFVFASPDLRLLSAPAVFDTLAATLDTVLP